MTDRDRAPVSSENLIPKGLPHGSRERLVNARRAAGVPVEDRGLPQGPQMRGEQIGAVGRVGNRNAVRPVDPRFDILTQATPEAMPNITSRDPSRELVTRGAPAPTLVARIDAMGQAANSRYMKAVAQRMRLRQQTG